MKPAHANRELLLVDRAVFQYCIIQFGVMATCMVSNSHDIVWLEGME